MSETTEISKASIQLIVHGVVQGVGFRLFARTVALGLNLVGWVRNRAGGTVEIYAEGPRPALQRLLQRMEEGPDSGYVSYVDSQWGVPAGEFETFQIRY